MAGTVQAASPTRHISAAHGVALKKVHDQSYSGSRFLGVSSGATPTPIN
jgi:hypothetical protein